MNRRITNTEMIELAASKLGPFNDMVVFVGGSVVGLLATSPVATDVRFTEDVDVVVEIVTYAQYSMFTEDLRKLGFLNDMEGPNCRMIIDGLKIDIMPTEESILGFKNK